MAWHLVVCTWLAQAALGGSAVMLAGCLAARACKQPVRRLRVIELTLLGCLSVPWLGRLPFVPHWSAGLFGAEPEEVLSAAEPEEAAGGSRAGQLPESFSPPAAVSQSQASAVTPASPEVSAVAAAATDAGLAGPGGDARPSFRWPPLTLLVVVAYALLAALVAARWCVGLARLRRLRLGARPVAPHVAGLFHEVAGARRRPVALLTSDRIDLPLTFGLFRPVILLPEGLCEETDPAGVRYALAHEWSHVERRDLFRWHLAALAGLLFFWQPLFWWLRRRLRLDQDFLADARAAGEADVPEDYASYLVSLAKRSVGPPAECGARHR